MKEITGVNKRHGKSNSVKMTEIAETVGVGANWSTGWQYLYSYFSWRPLPAKCGRNH